jgi:hypothetical protein
VTVDRQRLAHHKEYGPRPVRDRRLLLLGGLAGVASTLFYLAGQTILPWDHDLPVELSRWQVALTFWVTLAIAPFAITGAHAIYRLIAQEREGALNQLGFVFAVVAFSILALTQSFQLAVPSILTEAMRADGSGPEAWTRIYEGLNALDQGTDLAWDLFLALYMLCIGVAMLGHSRLGLRWGLPLLALIPAFLAFNIAATPTPPLVDLGPVIGLYFFALNIRLVWLGATRPRAKRDRSHSLSGNESPMTG